MVFHEVSTPSYLTADGRSSRSSVSMAFISTLTARVDRLRYSFAVPQPVFQHLTCGLNLKEGTTNDPDITVSTGVIGEPRRDYLLVRP
jgi:hypothetical protein